MCPTDFPLLININDVCLSTETTNRHHIDVDGEYVALDILDTAGKVNSTQKNLVVILLLSPGRVAWSCQVTVLPSSLAFPDSMFLG